MLYIRLVFTILLIAFYSKAQANFDFNENCKKAYQNIIELKINSARALIVAEKKNNPTNSIPYLLDSYVDYFNFITSENKLDFGRFKESKSSRISRIEKDDKNSPYYLFALAEINLQLALSRSKEKEYFTASLEFNKAYNFLKENSKKFPEFLPNQKSLAIIHAVLGSFPSGLSSALSAFGIRGDTRTGVQTLENLIEALPKSNYAHFYDETVFYYSVIQTDIISDSNNYYKIIKITDPIESESLLKTYIRAYAGIKLGYSMQSLDELKKRPRGPLYASYPYLDYLTGLAKMQNLDQGAAISFNAYLKSNRGTNLIKDSYLQLAWLELIKGNEQMYKKYTDLVKTKGFIENNRDIQALKEVKYGIPNLNLLRARLLFDGGNYEKALAQLSNKSTQSFKTLMHQIEFNYRMGRIYDLILRYDQALKYYQVAIDLGKLQPYSFAANSALRSGIIYEKNKNIGRAKHYFNLAISMKNHDYENSIENRAKEGLKRLNNQNL
jgi:predicted negative regulator of RcsB-dependent stress response